MSRILLPISHQVRVSIPSVSSLTQLPRKFSTTAFKMATSSEGHTGGLQSILHSVVGPKKEITDLSGRTAIITGGAKGIGYEIARAFAMEKARVIMINRKEEEGLAAIEKIKQEVGPEAVIEWRPCDLGNLKDVKKVFDDLREKEDRLDLLILSAGLNAQQYAEDDDGIERCFGINFLGHYYAVNLLFPLLRKTARMPDARPPRIVFESSELHRAADSGCHFSSLEEINDKNLGAPATYGRSKLAMILFAKFLLRDKVIKPSKDDIYALSVHPGTVNTGMQQQWKNAYPGLLGKLITNATLAVGRDPEQGAYSALYAATSPEVEEKGWNGYYFSDPSTPGKESSQASDAELAESLWNLSEQLVTSKVGKDALVPWDQVKN